MELAETYYYRHKQLSVTCNSIYSRYLHIHNKANVNTFILITKKQH